MKKKAANLRIPPKYVDKTTGLEKPKNAAHLLKDIKRLLESQGSAPTGLIVSAGYSEEYRNKVIHDGLAVKRNEADEILQKTKRLFTMLAGIAQAS